MPTPPARPLLLGSKGCGNAIVEFAFALAGLHLDCEEVDYSPGHAAREAFHRWAVFLVAAVYPTFTYGDDPRKWVADEAGAKQLRESTDRHRESLYRQMEAAAGAPWFLGDTFSAIDLYLLAMTRWRPGRKWFEANAPRLVAAADRAAVLPSVAPVAGALRRLYRSTGSPAARHSGKPSSSRRALMPRSRSVRTASNDMRQ